MTLILSPNLRRSSNPAQMSISGGISTGADWNETITITDGDGAQVTGVSSDDFELQFRSWPLCPPSDILSYLTLTSSGGDLTVTEGASATTIAISVDAGDLSGLYPGDYQVDLISESSAGTSTHRGSGRVTVFGSPIPIS